MFRGFRARLFMCFCARTLCMMQLISVQILLGAFFLFCIVALARAQSLQFLRENRNILIEFLPKNYRSAVDLEMFSDESSPPSFGERGGEGGRWILMGLRFSWPLPGTLCDLWADDDADAMQAEVDPVVGIIVRETKKKTKIFENYRLILKNSQGASSRCNRGTCFGCQSPRKVKNSMRFGWIKSCSVSFTFFTIRCFDLDVAV